MKLNSMMPQRPALLPAAGLFGLLRKVAATAAQETGSIFWKFASMEIGGILSARKQRQRQADGCVGDQAMEKSRA